VDVWKWVQLFSSRRIYVRKRIAALVIAETMIRIPNDVGWLWIAIEPVNRTDLCAYFKGQNQAYSRSIPENPGKDL
jgi:transposase-like protein